MGKTSGSGAGQGTRSWPCLLHRGEQRKQAWIKWPQKVRNCANKHAKSIFIQGREKATCVCFMSAVSSLEKDLVQFSQFRSSVVSDSLWPHGLQHARPPCPSPTPGVYSNSCPLSRWCHPTISSSVIPFCSCPQFFPVSGSFQMSQLFTWGGQSIGVSASTSVLPMNTQD